MKRKNLKLKSCFVIMAITFCQINCSGQANAQSKDYKFRLLTYGLPNFERENAKQVVSKRWQIEFYPVAGCVVEKQLVDSVAKENISEEHQIQNTYGKNWRDKFEKEVDKEFKLQDEIVTLINKQLFIKKTTQELEGKNCNLFFSMEPIKTKNQYAVKAYTYCDWKGETEYLTYYRLLVDCRKMVRVISSKIEKE